MKTFVLVTKITPMLLALCHFVNCILSYYNINTIILNYIGGISLIPIVYLYFISYVIKLCEYYRMYLHYSILINLLNIYDYYVGIPVDNRGLISIYVAITIVIVKLLLLLLYM